MGRKSDPEHRFGRLELGHCRHRKVQERCGRPCRRLGGTLSGAIGGPAATGERQRGHQQPGQETGRKSWQAVAHGRENLEEGSSASYSACLCLRLTEMPKLKTRKAAAKRFKATGSGKFMRRHAFRNHLLDHKSPKRKRFLGTMAVVDERDHDNVSLMLPYA
jgi:large subunit ribosomal protein L35